MLRAAHNFFHFSIIFKLSRVDFLMVVMASGIARGRVRTTTTTVESRKMAAILEMIGRQRHAALVYRVLLRIYDIMS